MQADKHILSHTFADIFPVLSDSDLAALAQDIRQNGQRDPIQLFQGKILDGRNRHMACLLAGIDPKFVEFDGDEQQALSAVVSWNIHRRHLDTSQRAMFAARIEPMFAAIAKERQRTAGKLYGEKHSKPQEVVPNSAQPLEVEGQKARTEAAKATKVGHNSVSLAKTVLAKGSNELIKAVDHGKIPVSTAAKLVDLPEAKQNEIANNGAKAATSAAKKIGRLKATSNLERSQTQITITDPIKVSPGDTWQLGRHLLYCGDSSTWRPAQRAKMAFADPPYNGNVADWDNGFNWQHDWLQECADYAFVTPGIANHQSFLAGTAMTYRWTYVHWLCNAISKPNDWGLSNLIHALLFSDLPSLRLEKHPDFVKESVNQQNNFATAHPGRKPDSLLIWLIDMVTKPGDLVIDPFLGSGTTLLACEASDRICHGCEISPEYCGEIISRWQSMTGQLASKLS